MFSQTVGVEDYFDYICDMRYLGAEDNDLCAKTGRLLPGDRARGGGEEGRGEKDGKRGRWHAGENRKGTCVICREDCTYSALQDDYV